MLVDPLSAVLPDNPRMTCAWFLSLCAPNFGETAQKVIWPLQDAPHSQLNKVSEDSKNTTKCSHQPSGSSAGLNLKSWFTSISCAKAMLVTSFAVCISSSTATTLGELAERDTNMYYPLNEKSTRLDPPQGVYIKGSNTRLHRLFDDQSALTLECHITCQRSKSFWNEEHENKCNSCLLWGASSGCGIGVPVRILSLTISSEASSKLFFSESMFPAVSKWSVFFDMLRTHVSNLNHTIHS